MNLKQNFVKNNCERMLEFAFDLIDEVSSKNYGQGEENEILKVKVGIHGGEVISDIIGFHKVQFSLFGDPVNTTSRIASKAEDDIVTVSEFIYQKIQKLSGLDFQPMIIDVYLFEFEESNFFPI